MERKDKYVPKNKQKWLENIADHYTKSANDDPRDFVKMKENYDIMVGDLDLDILNKSFNPMELKQTKLEVESKDQIIPIILPSINTLIGEIYDRSIDFRAYVMNPEAISDKENYIKKEMEKRLDSLIKQKESENLSEEQYKLELGKLNQWKTFESQDVRERFANHIIRDHIERLKFQQITKEGWKDMIGNVNEIYMFQIVSGNVTFKNIHPLNIKVFGLPDNGNIHEAEAISYERYMTHTEIIATYDLTKSQINKILDRDEHGDIVEPGVLMFSKDPVTDEDGMLMYDVHDNKFFTDDEFHGREKDRLLVRTVYFKALRKIYKLHFIDENGDEQIETVSGEYKVNKENGEWVKTDYYPEYWEITKLLSDVYINGKVCDVQMRDMNNPKLVYAPIVGKILKVGNRIMKSVVDILKPIQYQWTTFSKKVSELWARNLGQLVKIDISKIPKKYGFDLDLYMSWIRSFGIIVEDPFNEGMKGQPSGQFSSSVQAVNLELSNSIQMALNYMMYLRELADETVGITRQRRGNLMASDGLGTTQESISRSLKITEEIFQEHHSLQQILLKYILEYAKHSMSTGENKKIQYITDDMSYHLCEIDNDKFVAADYGIFINNARKQFELEQTFMQLAHAGMQNGTVKLSEIMDLMNTTSMSVKINKLKTAEQQQELRQKELQEQQQQHAQQLQEMTRQLRQEEMDHEIELQNLKNEADIQVARINAQSKLDSKDLENQQKDKNNESREKTEGDKNRYNYKKQQTNKK